MPTLFSSQPELEKALSEGLSTPDTIDLLIYNACFADISIRDYCIAKIHELAEKEGVVPSSIKPLYLAIGKGEVSGFTVPALNLRALSFDVAFTIFSLMKKRSIGPVVFELARSEMEYTDQPPKLYAATIIAGAIKAGFQGPIFILGDHFQINAKKYKTNPDEELDSIKALIKESVEAKILNIDIDGSTLVDLSKEELSEQQIENGKVTAALAEYIQTIEPTVSIGGEIGHIGDKNSTTEDLRAFIKIYQAKTNAHLSKVSIQTGTSHGGTMMDDGNLKTVSVDFESLQEIGEVARKEFSLGGVVQHGASTLPLESFPKFKDVKTLEVHLASNFQTILFENLPIALNDEITDWINLELVHKRTQEDTDEQFIYKNRKYALKQFKKALWELSDEEKKTALSKTEEFIGQIFTSFNLDNTQSLIAPYLSAVV